MSENINSQEQHQENEPTVLDIINICVEQLGEEVKEDFYGLVFSEALGYAYTILLENGIDPDELFTKKEIIE